MAAGQTYIQAWRENWKIWLLVHVPGCAVVAALNYWLFT